VDIVGINERNWNQEVVSFSRYAEGRACPVSGSISVVNDLTGTHPIETRIPTSLEEAKLQIDFISERGIFLQTQMC
jgi:hypothetical protein